MRNLFVLALLAAFSCGCAGVMEFKLPREFKGKKQVEDPPLSFCPPAAEAACV